MTASLYEIIYLLYAIILIYCMIFIISYHTISYDIIILYCIVDKGSNQLNGGAVSNQLDCTGKVLMNHVKW